MSNPHRLSCGRPRGSLVSDQVIIEPGWIFGWTATFSSPGMVGRRNHWTWRPRKDSAHKVACRKRVRRRVFLDKQGVKYDRWEAKREVRTCKSYD